MPSALLRSRGIHGDPIDAFEAVASGLHLSAERVDGDELHVALPGAWREIGMWLNWRPEIATLQMGAPLDLRAPGERIDDACRLLALVNERLWIGHFDLWSEDNAFVYRNAIVLPDTGAIERGQAERLLKGAAESIDRFYPAFNFFIWGGKDPEGALQASLFETSGSA
jgi:hypothetical protein